MCLNYTGSVLKYPPPMTVVMKGGENAPVTGTYEAIDLDGQPAGMLAARRFGEPLPRLPRGFRWRQMT